MLLLVAPSLVIALLGLVRARPAKRAGETAEAGYISPS